MSKKNYHNSQLRNQMKPNARKNDALKWLSTNNMPRENLLIEYMNRYNMEQHIAFEELSLMGYHDEAQICIYNQQGIKWEYQYDGYSGEMKVVPNGTPEWELYNY